MVASKKVKHPKKKAQTTQGAQELCTACQELCTACPSPATRQYKCQMACAELYPACDRCDLDQKAKKEADKKNKDRLKVASIFRRGSCMFEHMNEKLWYLLTRRLVLELVEPVAPADEVRQAAPVRAEPPRAAQAAQPPPAGAQEPPAQGGGDGGGDNHSGVRPSDKHSGVRLPPTTAGSSPPLTTIREGPIGNTYSAQKGSDSASDQGSSDGPGPAPHAIDDDVQQDTLATCGGSDGGAAMPAATVPGGASCGLPVQIKKACLQVAAPEDAMCCSASAPGPLAHAAEDPHALDLHLQAALHDGDAFGAIPRRPAASCGAPPPPPRPPLKEERWMLLAELKELKKEAWMLEAERDFDYLCSRVREVHGEEEEEEEEDEDEEEEDRRQRLTTVPRSLPAPTGDASPETWGTQEARIDDAELKAPRPAGSMKVIIMSNAGSRTR